MVLSNECHPIHDLFATELPFVMEEAMSSTQKKKTKKHPGFGKPTLLVIMVTSVILSYLVVTVYTTIVDMFPESALMQLSTNVEGLKIKQQGQKPWHRSDTEASIDNKESVMARIRTKCPTFSKCDYAYYNRVMRETCATNKDDNVVACKAIARMDDLSRVNRLILSLPSLGHRIARGEPIFRSIVAFMSDVAQVTQATTLDMGCKSLMIAIYPVIFVWLAKSAYYQVMTRRKKFDINRGHSIYLSNEEESQHQSTRESRNHEVRLLNFVRNINKAADLRRILWTLSDHPDSVNQTMARIENYLLSPTFFETRGLGTLRDLIMWAKTGNNAAASQRLYSRVMHGDRHAMLLQAAATPLPLPKPLSPDQKLKDGLENVKEFLQKDTKAFVKLEEIVTSKKKREVTEGIKKERVVVEPKKKRVVKDANGPALTDLSDQPDRPDQSRQPRQSGQPRRSSRLAKI